MVIKVENYSPKIDIKILNESAIRNELSKLNGV